MYQITAEHLYHLREDASHLIPGINFKSCSPFLSFSTEVNNGKGNGNSTDFCEHRLYQYGDSPHRIDWKVTARLGTPWIRHFHEENNKIVLFLLDFSIGMFFSSQSLCKSVITLQTFALLGWAAIDQGYSVGAMALTEEGNIPFRERKGEHCFHLLLKTLSDLHKEQSNKLLKNASHDPAYFGRGLHQLLRSSSTGSSLIIISDFINMDACSWVHLEAASANNAASAIRVSDPLEAGCLPKGIFPVSDGEQAGVIACYDAESHQRFTDTCKQHFKCIKSYFFERQIDLMDLTTKIPASKQLLSFYEEKTYGHL